MKIGRNDKCPCESGKKYKHCCGSKKAIDEQALNQKLNSCYNKLVSQGLKKYKANLEIEMAQYPSSSFENDRESQDVYRTGLIIWLLNQPFLANDKSIFDWFADKYTVDPIVKRYFDKWRLQKPLIYEVISVADNGEAVVLQELQSGKTYKVIHSPEDHYLEGSLVIGTLLAYPSYYIFLYSSIKLFEVNKDDVLKLLREKQQDFPYLLKNILMKGIELNQYLRPVHHEVAQKFADKMVEEGISDAIILEGIKVWNNYCRSENPNIRNMKGYVAALEYYVLKHIVNEDSVTQDKLAEKYDIPKTTLSSNYRKIAK